jgi:uncharacterized RDD family membrane protein YckC
LDQEHFVDSDEAYAEWYAWAKREVSPDPTVCVGAAQAAMAARLDGGDRAEAELAARQSMAGEGVLLAQRVSQRRRAYAEWYHWARRDLRADPSRLHAVAAAALRTLDSGGSSQEAAETARQAAGTLLPTPGRGPTLDRDLRAANYAPGQHVGPLPEPPSKPGQMYAGLTRRGFAFLFDAVILLIAAYVTLILVTSAPGIFDNGWIILVWLLFWIVMAWGYWAGLESSPLQATLGKAALGVVVTDGRGERLGFWRATARHFATWLTMGLGTITAAFTQRKQGLQDMMAGTLVVRRDYVPLIAHLAEQQATHPPPPAPPAPGYQEAYGANS